MMKAFASVLMFKLTYRIWQEENYSHYIYYTYTSLVHAYCQWCLQKTTNHDVVMQMPSLHACALVSDTTI